MMSRQEVDRALASLGAESDRAAAALYAMDTHPAHALLAGSQNRGVTARAWAAAQATMGEAWAGFTAFGAGLEMARDARARRFRPGTAELIDLTDLLTGKVVAADPGAVTATGWITLREAASRIVSGCRSVTEVFDRVVTAHGTVTAELARIAADLAEVGRLLAALNDTPELKARAGPWVLNADPECAAALRADTEELIALRKQLTTAGAVAAADPLGAVDATGAVATSAELHRLAAAAAAARHRAAGAVELRAGLPARLAALETAVRDLAAAEEAVRGSYAVAVEKIADPGLPPLPSAAPALAGRLAEARRSAPPPHEPLGSAVTERADAALSAVERDIVAARERADALRTAADGLLDRRAELRGRLDAYRVKGARLGFAEHPDLTVRYRLAHDLLHTRPCDLPAATRAVHGYQHLLATLAGPEQGRIRP